MSDINVLPAEEIADFVEIVARAYPSMNVKTPEEKQRFGEMLLSGHVKDPSTHLYALYREDTMLGGMRLFNFRLNLLSHMVDAGGVGLVAVDLVHKKEKIAKDLISYFLEHYHARGAVMALLYPFRPDFYKRMGFGFGTKLNQYRVRPAQLPQGSSKAHIRYLKEDDVPEVLACYSRYTAATHGMIERSDFNIRHLLTDTRFTVVGYERDGRIEGYLAFSFKSAKADNFLLNDLHVEEYIYEHGTALLELLTFLHSQADQINNVILNTQEQHFHHLLFDPRNTSNNVIPHVSHETNSQAIGLMYRVLDTRRLFAVLGDHSFGGQNITVTFAIRDSFFTRNDGEVTVRFADGRPTIVDGDNADVTIGIDVADFSSLLVGVVAFRHLHTYGLATISDSRHIPTIDALFATADQPKCVTRF